MFPQRTLIVVRKRALTHATFACTCSEASFPGVMPDAGWCKCVIKWGQSRGWSWEWRGSWRYLAMETKQSWEGLESLAWSYPIAASSASDSTGRAQGFQRARRSPWRPLHFTRCHSAWNLPRATSPCRNWLQAQERRFWRNGDPLWTDHALGEISHWRRMFFQHPRGG